MKCERKSSETVFVITKSITEIARSYANAHQTEICTAIKAEQVSSEKKARLCCQHAPNSKKRLMWCNAYRFMAFSLSNCVACKPATHIKSWLRHIASNNGGPCKYQRTTAKFALYANMKAVLWQQPTTKNARSHSSKFSIRNDKCLIEIDWEKMKIGGAVKRANMPQVRFDTVNR